MKQSVIEKPFGTTVYRRDFDSINDLNNFCESGTRNTVSFSRSAAEEGRQDFTLTSSYEDARRLLVEGWEEGSKKLTEALRVENVKRPSAEVKRQVFDIVGFQASVPRYLQGIPTNMVNQKTVKQKQKIINLYKSITYNAGVSANEILADSVKFLQIMQELEKKGFRVNAYTYFHATKGSEEILQTVKIKSASERISIAKMSFPLMHPSMLRRITFKAMENEDRVTQRGWGMGYGKPGNVGEMKRFVDKNSFVIPTLISNEEAMSLISGADELK